jgi:hypothetical protein
MARQFSVPAQLPPIMLLAPAADAAGRTSAYRSLRDCLKGWVICHINQGNAAPVTVSLLQATAVAGNGSKALLNTTPIWANINTGANDSYVKQTAATSFTTDAGTNDKIVIFEIQPESCLDVVNGFNSIAVVTSASNAANITEATLMFLGGIQGATLPNSYTDI